MKAILIRDIRRFVSPRLLFLMLGCALFSLAERQSFSQSYDNFVLNMLSEHYYLTFFMVPMFLYILYNHLEDDMDYVLIRVKRYPRYFAARAAAMIVNMFIFVLLQLAVFLMIGIGLPLESAFPLPDPNNPSLDVLVLFSETFQHPWQASVVSALYMIVGLSVLSILFMALYHFFEKRVVSILTVMLFFLMVFAMKSKIPGLTRIPFIFINNYIIYMYNLSYPYAIWVSVITMGMITGGVAFFISKSWNKRPSMRISWYKPSGIMPYYMSQLFSFRNSAILASIIFGLSLWKLIQVRSAPDSTLTDFMLLTFWGHGHGYFQAMEFITMMIMNSAPIYLLALFLENEKKDHSIMLTVRLRSKWQWGASVVGVSSLYLIVYVLLLIGGSLVVGIGRGLSTGEVTIFSGITMDMPRLLLYLVAVKILELLFQFLFLFIIFLWTRQVTAAFAGILVMYGLYLLPFPWIKYIPVGMSSLVQHEGFGTAADSAIFGLSGGLIILLLGSLVVLLSLYTLLVGYKKRFQ